MKIRLTSVLVKDQSQALAFYTDVLGFVKKTDFPVHGEFRWITLVSAQDLNGVELALEPTDNPAAATFQEALFSQGIPSTAFFVDDIDAEFTRLKGLGVEFKGPVKKEAWGSYAVLNDTAGNWIQIQQV